MDVLRSVTMIRPSVCPAWIIAMAMTPPAPCLAISAAVKKAPTACLAIPAAVKKATTACLAISSVVKKATAACLVAEADQPIPTFLQRISPITMQCPIVCHTGTACPVGRMAMASALAGMAGPATCHPDAPTRHS